MKYLSMFIFIVSQLIPLSCWSHEAFQWTSEMSDCAKIQMQIAGPGIIQNVVQVSGKISIHPDHHAYVSPKVTGAVWQIRKTLGDNVKKGEVLALIESKEISEAKAEYLTALKKFHLQQVLLTREKDLKGISAEQDYLRAELASEEAYINYECALQNLYTLGFNEEEISKIGQEHPTNRRFHEIKAPLSGKILQRNLTLGELVNNTTRAFEIANFESIWIEANVAQNDVQFLKEGQPVDVITADGKRASVTICQFNPIISEETRMATAIAVMENASETWTPGEFVTVYIQTNPLHLPLVVSREAVQMVKGEPCIFVETNGFLTPRFVKLGEMDEKNVEVVSGLILGESYAACNVFCLKAEYEKEEGEHHH